MSVPTAFSEPAPSPVWYVMEELCTWKQLEAFPPTDGSCPCPPPPPQASSSHELPSCG